MKYVSNWHDCLSKYKEHLKMLTMKSSPSINVGIIVALSAVKKTLEMYPEGMTGDQIDDMMIEIDQQLGLKNTELLLENRA